LSLQVQGGLALFNFVQLFGDGSISLDVGNDVYLIEGTIGTIDRLEHPGDPVQPPLPSL
jgi:hypothetical protein